MEISGGRAVATIFAVLMATSMVAMPAMAGGLGSNSADERGVATGAHQPAVGPLDRPGDDGSPALGGSPGSGGGPPGHDRGSGVSLVAIPDLEENTTVESILSATERLDALDLDGTDRPAAANDTVAAINATLREYRQLNRAASREAFDHLAAAQRAFGDLAGAVDDDEGIVDDASEGVYAASNATARLAVADAGHVVATNQDEFSNPGQRQKAESALGNALDALERADGPADAPKERAQAITHHENAWKHAERALDVVEDNTEPTLSLSQGQAFERNGTVLVPLEATLQDVRPYAYDEAAVTVEGAAGDPDPIPFVPPESAGGSTTGTTLVDLGPDAENATVTVSATAEHDAERTAEATREIRVDGDEVIPERPAPDEHAEIEVTDDDSGVSVAVGGDGLHERDVSITDRTPETDDAYRAGPMVRVENATPIDEATIEIPVDEAALDRGGNLSVVTWDPHDEEPWTAVETEIDRDAGVATADVDHFSFFSVFRIDDWEDETSDTITLDDERIDNGTQIEKADFAFVIDESGSMSGSPIHYAELAGQRFVGALTDDERAALVGYAGGASLDQPLTSDHEAVNASLASLSTGGGTDTEAGLREGLAHLQANGWDNRSKVMILLSDGNSNGGSYPRDAAEDAADADVEISTVGLGNNVDEDELRDIAATTGGDYYHVEDSEDLPDTFERVAENQTGVQLNDTNGDGIPDVVAEMDLRMPTGGPGVVGEPLHLDPVDPDTSGDGIPDNETVTIDYRVFEEDNETKLYASVTDAEHHPARVDTTGDGVSDARQLAGWNVAYTTDRSDSLEYLSELESLEDVDDLEDVEDDLLEIETARADPLVNDTSGDGLTDVEELALGTNPEKRDTTGDGIPDATADRRGLDPTLFDVAPPDVSVTYATFNDPDVDVGIDPRDWSARVSGSYEVDFLAFDPAGLDEVRVVRDGDVEESIPQYGARQADEYVEFDVGTVDTFTDAFAGARVTVQADDRHDNADGIGTAEVGAVEHGGVWSELSDTIRSHGGTTSGIESDLGFMQGMTTGSAETIDFFLALYEDPIGTIAALREIPEAVRNFDEIVAAMPEAIDAQQQANNPHEPGDEHYEAYRQGWYEGYVAWFVVEALLPAGEAGKAIKSSDRLQSTVDAVATPRIRQAARSAGRAGHTATAPIRYTRHQFSRAIHGSIGLSQDAARNVVEAVRSIGSQHRVAKHLQDVDLRTIDRLSPDQRERLGRALASVGEDGAATVDRLDAPAVDSLLELPPGQRATTLDRLADVDPARLADLGGQHDDLVLAVAREGDVGRAVNDFDSAASVAVTDSEVVVRGTRGGVDVDVTYTRDGEGFYVSRSDRVDSIEDLRDLTSQQIGRTVAEEDVAPTLVGDRPAQEVVYSGRGADPGIDMIVRDAAADEYVIAEVKFTQSTDKINKGTFSSTRTLDDGTEARQMSDEWIEDAFQKEIIDEGVDVPMDLRASVQDGTYRKEAIVIQDRTPGNTIAGTLSDPVLDFDTVAITRTDGVTLDE